MSYPFSIFKNVRPSPFENEELSLESLDLSEVSLVKFLIGSYKSPYFVVFGEL